MIGKTKFLDIIIDQNLPFQSHMSGEVARGIGILYKSRPYSNLDTMRTLYNTFSYPHLIYCIGVSDNTYKAYSEPLVKMQNVLLEPLLEPESMCILHLYS